jgi:hypothetical protein
MNGAMAEPIPKGPIPSWQENVGRSCEVMEDMLTSLFHDSRACRKIGFTNIRRLAGFIPARGKALKKERPTDGYRFISFGKKRNPLSGGAKNGGSS